MTSFVLDASAVLRFLDNEAGAELVENLLNRAREREVVLHISVVNWGEIIYAIARAHGSSAARQADASLTALPITVAACNAREAAAAGLLKEKYKIPYADAFAAVLAVQLGATLVTADFDFKSIQVGDLKVQFLPAKP